MKNVFDQFSSRLTSWYRFYFCTAFNLRRSKFFVLVFLNILRAASPTRSSFANGEPLTPSSPDTTNRVSQGRKWKKKGCMTSHTRKQNRKWSVANIFFSFIERFHVTSRSPCCCSILRWFVTVFYFPLQLNFMTGLLVCSKRLLLLVDSRCCNNLSTYQLLYSHWHFSCHGNLTGPQTHPISSIQLHVVGKLPFLLH